MTTNLAQTLRFRTDDGAELWVEKPIGESVEHAAAKAYLWFLYRERFPNLVVEPPSNFGRSTPDVVATDDFGRVVFWAEAGRNRRGKLARVCSAHRDALVAVARWGMSTQAIRSYVTPQTKRLRNLPEIHMVSLPRDFLDTCFQPDGHAYRILPNPGVVVEPF